MGQAPNGGRDKDREQEPQMSILIQISAGVVRLVALFGLRWMTRQIWCPTTRLKETCECLPADLHRLSTARP